MKTEPKMEPTDGGSGGGQGGQYSLADLDSITDLLPIQTGRWQHCNLQLMSQYEFLDFKVDAVSLNDLDFWDKGNERAAESGYVVTTRPGHLEARYCYRLISLYETRTIWLSMSHLN